MTSALRRIGRNAASSLRVTPPRLARSFCSGRSSGRSLGRKPSRAATTVSSTSSSSTAPGRARVAGGTRAGCPAKTKTPSAFNVPFGLGTTRPRSSSVNDVPAAAGGAELISTVSPPKEASVGSATASFEVLTGSMLVMNRSSSVTIDGAFGVFGAMAQMPVVAYFASISCAVSSRGCSCCGTRIASKTAPSSSLSVGSSAATVVSAVFSGGACGTMGSSRLSTCCLTAGSGGAEAVCVVSRLPKSRESANPSSRKTDAQAATPARNTSKAAVRTSPKKRGLPPMDCSLRAPKTVIWSTSLAPVARALPGMGAAFAAIGLGGGGVARGLRRFRKPKGDDLAGCVGLKPVNELLSGTGPPVCDKGCTLPRAAAPVTMGALRRLEKSAGALVAAGAAGGALDTAGAGLGVAAAFFSTDGAAGFCTAGATRGASSFTALGAGASAGFWLAG